MKKHLIRFSTLMVAMVMFGCNDDSSKSPQNAPAIDENKPCEYNVEEQYRKCAEMDGVSVYEFCHPDGVIKSIECDGACTTPKSCKLPNDKCAPGTHKCNYGDSLFSEMGVGMVCDNNGVWKKDQDCASGVCNGTRCGKLADTEICKGVTESRCEDNADGMGILATCTDETRTRTECNASCKNDKECGTCISGKTKCENITTKDRLGNDIEVGQITGCENGEPVERLCDYERKCADETSCEICNETECKAQSTPAGEVAIITMTCSNETVTYSCGMASCNIATKGCGECQNGSKRCENHEEDGKLIGYFETCEDGLYKNLTRCAEDVSCYGERSCGNCVNGDTKCEIDNWGGEHAFVYFCVDGSWSTSHDYQCPTDQCTSDNKMCAFSTAQICVQRDYGETGRIVIKENNGYTFKDCDNEAAKAA